MCSTPCKAHKMHNMVVLSSLSGHRRYSSAGYKEPLDTSGRACPTLIMLKWLRQEHSSFSMTVKAAKSELSPCMLPSVQARH